MNTRSMRCRVTAWYAGLLACSLVLFGSSVYVGLEQYLRRSLADSLTREGRQIGETVLLNGTFGGDAYISDEINEHVQPELNGHLVRVLREDGGVLYQSGIPRDGSFNPSEVPIPSIDLTEVSTRKHFVSTGAALLVCTVPFTARDGNRFLIEIGTPLKESDTVLRGLLLALGLGMPVVVAVAIGGGYFLMRRVLSPVGEITRSAEQITTRNLTERLPEPKTGDELEALSIALNKMIARIEHSFRHMNRFTADASHELRTPLTILRGELEVMAQRPDINPETRDAIGSALEETERLSKIVESLLAISRLDAGEAIKTRERFDLAKLVSSTADQMRLLAEDKEIVLRCAAAAAVDVEGDPARLKQVVVNLIDNAIKYTSIGGEVDIKVQAANGNAILEVTDTGIGMPPEALPHVFERFYRVDGARSRQMGGAGLGLSIVKSICRAH